MAESFISYQRHGVAESSALLGTEGGAHVLNVKIPANMDNGSFLSYKGFVAGDVWEVDEPDAAKPVFLLLTSPLIYSEYTPRMQEESNFYNAKDDIGRAYHLQRFDRFALSEEAFAQGATPAVGSYLTFSAGSYKAGLTTTKPNSGFVAKIYDQATNGNWRVIVEEAI